MVITARRSPFMVHTFSLSSVVACFMAMSAVPVQAQTQTSAPAQTRTQGQAQAQAQAAPEHEAVEVKKLLSADASWDGVPYLAYPPGRPQVSLLRIRIPPKTTLPWHTHAMPNAAYVVSGSLTVQAKEGARRSLVAGDVLPEMVNAVHRGTSGPEGAELLVFYAGVKGQPLSIPAR